MAGVLERIITTGVIFFITICICISQPSKVDKSATGLDISSYQLFRNPTGSTTNTNMLSFNTEVIFASDERNKLVVFYSAAAMLSGKRALLRLGVRDYSIRSSIVPVVIDLFINVMHTALIDIGIAGTFNTINSILESYNPGTPVFTSNVLLSSHNSSKYGAAIFGGPSFVPGSTSIGFDYGIGLWFTILQQLAFICDGRAFGNDDKGNVWGFAGLRCVLSPIQINIGYGALSKYSGPIIILAIIP